MNFPFLFFFLMFLPCTLPNTFELRRASPKGTSLTQLKIEDQHRLQFSGINLTLLGSYRPDIFGFYLTTIRIGTPPLEFNMIVDTGSPMSWVSCNGCTGCPSDSEFGMHLNYFDTRNSTSGSKVQCSNKACQAFTHPNCSSSSKCSYNFHYIEGSIIKGHLVSDIFYLDTTRTAPIVFGCTDYWSRYINYTYTVVDGMLALGPHSLSFISQLSSQRLAPMMFGHCLRGVKNGGGNLFLGEIQAPGLVYTPMKTSRQVYSVNLQSIAVNGHVLPIDPAVFALSDYGGTVVDSGMSLVVLAEKAYDTLIHFLTVAASQSARPVLSYEDPCFNVSSSIDETFPAISFIFEGGASMILTPNEYLLLDYQDEGFAIWCPGFHKVEGENMTILGELILANKIIVYDLAHQRLGWTNYNCSNNVNVRAHRSATSTKKPIWLYYLLVFIEVLVILG